MASLGLSSPLSPPRSLLPPARMAGSTLEFFSPFVLRTAGSVFQPVNFSLLSHSLKKLPPTALRAFRLVLTLSNAYRSSPFRLHLLVADAGVWGTFLLGVAFMHVICGFYLFSSQLGCPPRFENFPQTRRCEGFLVVWKLPLLRLPSREGSPSLTFCLSFYLLYFVLPPFEDNRLLFWVPDVLC